MGVAMTTSRPRFGLCWFTTDGGVPGRLSSLLWTSLKVNAIQSRRFDGIGAVMHQVVPGEGIAVGPVGQERIIYGAVRSAR